MRFGINFFPSCDPTLLSGQEYYRQALVQTARADELGITTYIGDPIEVADQIRKIVALFGPIEPSLQVMFGDISEAAARRSLELFAAEVMPRLSDLSSDPSQF